jgi:putative ABC transport system substrate-binding protein
MKRALPIIGLVLVALLAVLWFSSRTAEHPAIIGIVQFVHQPLLDETHRGLMAELTRLGLNDGKRYVVRTQVADKSFDSSAQMTRQFLNDQAVLLIAIATPAAQAAAAETARTPIVFAAITDPVAARLVNSIEHPGKNLTGTSNRWPFERQVALLSQLLPTAKRIGAVWNPGEVNSQAAMAALRPLLQQRGYELVEAPITTTADVALAARSVSHKVDAFLMIPDNTALAATDVLVQIAIDTKKPLIGGDMDTVRRGSLGTYGYNYFELGQVTAQMVKEILIDGRKPDSMPVRYPPTSSLILNQKSAARFALSLPQTLIQEAKEVVK